MSLLSVFACAPLASLTLLVAAFMCAVVLSIVIVAPSVFYSESARQRPKIVRVIIWVCFLVVVLFALFAIAAQVIAPLC